MASPPATQAGRRTVQNPLLIPTLRRLTHHECRYDPHRPTNPDQATRLLTNAERIANSITDEPFESSALSSVAKALAATHPDQATRLLTSAKRIANSITPRSSKALALRDVAKALAATDLDQAERFANSITDEFWKALALSSVAEVMSA